MRFDWRPSAVAEGARSAAVARLAHGPPTECSRTTSGDVGVLSVATHRSPVSSVAADVGHRPAACAHSRRGVASVEPDRSAAPRGAGPSLRHPACGHRPSVVAADVAGPYVRRSALLEGTGTRRRSLRRADALGTHRRHLLGHQRHRRRRGRLGQGGRVVGEVPRQPLGRDASASLEWRSHARGGRHRASEAGRLRVHRRRPRSPLSAVAMRRASACERQRRRVAAASCARGVEPSLTRTLGGRRLLNCRQVGSSAACRRPARNGRGHRPGMGTFRRRRDTACRSRTLPAVRSLRTLLELVADVAEPSARLHALGGWEWLPGGRGVGGKRRRRVRLWRSRRVETVGELLGGQVRVGFGQGDGVVVVFGAEVGEDAGVVGVGVADTVRCGQATVGDDAKRRRRAR